MHNAIAFFGPASTGLKMTLANEGEVRFVGGGGHVLVQAQEKGRALN